MVEPISGSLIVKAATSAMKNDVDSVSPGLLKSVLGPPAKELGDALARVVSYRTRNFGRIVEKAEARLHGRESSGAVNVRVAFSLLEEGSLCDGELMAEYLGGLLAASKSPDGRDDRAVTWTRIVTSLSSFQVRAHYLLYRELAIRLHEKAPDLDLTYVSQMKKATMRVRRDPFCEALMAIGECTEEDNEVILRHSILGLIRAGLLHDSWSYNDLTVEIRPTGRGIELYGWALGMPDLLPRNFISRASVLDISMALPRLEDGDVVFSKANKMTREAARLLHPSRGESDADL